MENNPYSAPLQYEDYHNMNNPFYRCIPEIDERHKKLRRLGMLGGTALILFTVMQFAVVFILRAFNLVEAYQNNPLVQHATGAVAPLFYVLLPFLILYICYNSEEKQSVDVFRKPRSAALFIYAVFSGIMICYAGDFFGSIFGSFSEGLGLEFSSADIQLPSNPIENILFIIEGAFVPALVEEFALRGILMQPLRKFGDKFAILITAFVFAILHGNMEQIPFAFICGIALGYFQIVTDSIWTSITIHFANNLIACVFSIISTNYSEDFVTLTYFLISGAFIFLGIIATILFAVNKNYKLKKDDSVFKGKVKAASYLCTPTLVLAIVFSFESTLKYTTVTKYFGMLLIIAVSIAFAILISKGRNTIRDDIRLTFSSVYTLSMVIAILSAVATGFSLVFSMVS